MGDLVPDLTPKGERNVKYAYFSVGVRPQNDHLTQLCAMSSPMARLYLEPSGDRMCHTEYPLLHLAVFWRSRLPGPLPEINKNMR
jgi:hypothetical protein